MAGMLADRKNKTTRSNELMSFLTIEDLFGQYEVLVFPKVLTASAEILATAKVLLISGRLSIREDDIPKLVADQIAELAVDAMCLPEGFFSRESRPTGARDPRRFRKPTELRQLPTCHQQSRLVPSLTRPVGTGWRSAIKACLTTKVINSFWPFWRIFAAQPRSAFICRRSTRRCNCPIIIGSNYPMPCSAFWSIDMARIIWASFHHSSGLRRKI